MSDKSWADLVTFIEDKFTNIKFEKQSKKIEKQPELEIRTEKITFSREGVIYCIERTVSPRIIDKKTFYHHRGSADRVEYQYDPEETSSKVTFYKQQTDGSFTPIEPESLLQ